MGLLSSPQSFLGIDFDSNSVKVVELKNDNGRPRLVTYGYYDETAEQSKEKSSEAVKGDSKKTAAIIREVCKKAKTTTTKVVTSLPAFSVFSSIISLPQMSKKDLPSAVKWEAKKIIPLPLEEMTLDWQILENPKRTTPAVDDTKNSTPAAEAPAYVTIPDDTDDTHVKILLTAAPKDLVRKYIDIFKAANLELLSLDTEPFALIRSLVGSDKSPIMLVDIGSVVTNITVVDKGVPFLNRSIDVGGLTITKAIANSLSVSMSRAEQFKYDIGMNPEKKGQGSVPQTIESSLRPIVDELQYTINLYRNQGRTELEKIVLTGGSSMLLNLPNYLSNKLGLRVFLGDPMARVIYPEELKPVLDEIGPRLSVAIGLAMRDID